MIIQLEKSSPAPMIYQIIDQIRIQCASGKLKQGDRLPGMRSLARYLGVHRNTIFTAYERLAAEGLLEMRHGDGAYVAAIPAQPQLDAHREELRREIRRLVSRTIQLGLAPADFFGLIEEAFDGQLAPLPEPSEEEE